MYVRIMSGVAAQEAMSALLTAYDAVADCDLGALTASGLLDFMDGLETLTCQLPTQSRRALARLQAETTPQKLGAKSWKDVLAIRWRITTSEAHRRLNEAAEMGPRQALTGEPLAPLLPAAAAAQAGGLINGEHVTVLRKAIKALPAWVDATTRGQFEVDLVRVAVGVGPKELKETAALRLFLLDQDGPEPDDTERARTRGLSKGKQQRNGNIPVRGELTPEAWATLEAIFAKYAAPGMCNPDDPEPCTSGTPSQAQIDNDHRSLAQRQHDALVVVGRIALMSGLGDLNGLPVSIIIRTTLQDLESRAGVGVTGGGTIIPIKDVIRLGAHAHHSLAVFDRATGSALDLFRTKRIASPAQRLMLIARDNGCTKPCCTVGAYGTQVHHVTADWAHGGNTNIDDLSLACGPDNRLVNTHGGWTTRMNDRHEVEWIPPPGLDTGQTRINYYHRPEALLRPPEDDSDAQPGADNTDPEPEPAQSLWDDAIATAVCDAESAAVPDMSAPLSPIEADEPPPSEPNQNTNADHEPFDPWPCAGDDQAGGGKGVRGP
ncbi:HNH endonuclease signature motif containing protein [Mycolicibacterium hippocampi]|uniref:13E12 repeat family protein n=1 Tax=Mycolicibacterium hippocampi TaxID=659824 RepID=A0A850PK01_9MYCO|nr:HNH endonuclease signature motif containing protein [Mycolicibacterium hippocampi]NVN48490.1 13E12 repeat family protein [Mycolicibacterium hippocampi]